MNTNIFCCLLDCSKAFDRISFHTLFTKLLTTCIPGIILLVLLYIYLHQQSRVIWNNVCSTTCCVSNGVRQGSMLSPIPFGFYMEDLICTVVVRSNIHVGCKIGNIFTGILVYADDIILLAPRREALQLMVNTCSSYATSHNLLFSTNIDPSKSKLKCLYFGYNKKNVDIKCIDLNNKALPFVTNTKHLGNIGPIHTKDARFFCCGNSAADISKPHTFKWDPLADEVLEAA